MKHAMSDKHRKAVRGTAKKVRTVEGTYAWYTVVDTSVPSGAYTFHLHPKPDFEPKKFAKVEAIHKHLVASGLNDDGLGDISKKGRFRACYGTAEYDAEAKGIKLTRVAGRLSDRGMEKVLLAPDLKKIIPDLSMVAEATESSGSVEDKLVAAIGGLDGLPTLPGTVDGVPALIPGAFGSIADLESVLGLLDDAQDAGELPDHLAAFRLALEGFYADLESWQPLHTEMIRDDVDGFIEALVLDDSSQAPMLDEIGERSEGLSDSELLEAKKESDRLSRDEAVLDLRARIDSLMMLKTATTRALEAAARVTDSHGTLAYLARAFTRLRMHVDEVKGLQGHAPSRKSLEGPIRDVMALPAQIRAVYDTSQDYSEVDATIAAVGLALDKAVQRQADLDLAVSMVQGGVLFIERATGIVDGLWPRLKELAKDKALPILATKGNILGRFDGGHFSEGMARRLETTALLTKRDEAWFTNELANASKAAQKALQGGGKTYAHYVQAWDTYGFTMVRKMEAKQAFSPDELVTLLNQCHDFLRDLSRFFANPLEYSSFLQSQGKDPAALEHVAAAAALDASIGVRVVSGVDVGTEPTAQELSLQARELAGKSLASGSVLVIGAGPVGLLTALEAVTLGPSVRLIEKRSGKKLHTRKNTVLMDDSLQQRLKSVGAWEALINREAMKSARENPESPRFSTAVAPIGEIEAALLEIVRKNSKIAFHEDWALKSSTNRDGRTAAVLSTPDGDQEVEFDLMVVALGAGIASKKGPEPSLGEQLGFSFLEKSLEDYAASGLFDTEAEEQWRSDQKDRKDKAVWSYRFDSPETAYVVRQLTPSQWKTLSGLREDAVQVQKRLSLAPNNLGRADILAHPEFRAAVEAADDYLITLVRLQAQFATAFELKDLAFSKVPNIIPNPDYDPLTDPIEDKWIVDPSDPLTAKLPSEFMIKLRQAIKASNPERSTVLVGDSAGTPHPATGKGLNMGAASVDALRDLMSGLVRGRQPDPTDMSVYSFEVGLRTDVMMEKANLEMNLKLNQMVDSRLPIWESSVTDLRTFDPDGDWESWWEKEKLLLGRLTAITTWRAGRGKTLKQQIADDIAAGGKMVFADEMLTRLRTVADRLNEGFPQAKKLAFYVDTWGALTDEEKAFEPTRVYYEDLIGRASKALETHSKVAVDALP